MDGLNRVHLLGNLGADPELRMTQSGQAVLSMRLATSETYLDRDKRRQERTEWHTVVLWGKRAEALGKLLHKGDRIYVEGGLRTTSYDDRDGNKRYKTEVIARDVLLQGSRDGARQRSAPQNESAGSLGEAAGAPPFGDDDDVPF